MCCIFHVLLQIKKKLNSGMECNFLFKQIKVSASTEIIIQGLEATLEINIIPKILQL